MLEMPSGPFLPSLFNRIYVPICKEMILQKIITISFRKLSQNSESTERLTHTLFQEWVLQVQLSVMVTFSLRVLPIFTSITGLLLQAQDALPFLVYQLQPIKFLPRLEDAPGSWVQTQRAQLHSIHQPQPCTSLLPSYTAPHLSGRSKNTWE